LEYAIIISGAIEKSLLYHVRIYPYDKFDSSPYDKFDNNPYVPFPR